MKRDDRLIPRFTLAFVLAWLAACSPAAPAGGSVPGPSPRDKAAAEATAIIQSAEATALVLQAQAKATALIQSASASGPAPAPTAQIPALTVTPLPTLKPSALQVTDTVPPLPSPVAEAVAAGTPDASAIQLVGVVIGEETGYIMVQFKAPPSVADRWQQGMVYVVDEATGALYNAIPVLPVVGPLFGRPKNVGQIGYVMFVNAAPGLRQGSLVTVVLGTFKQEHVTVQ